jgi:lipopolysaccharide/colanic/teichoic acid biosynthesis glycosyltransferase
MATTALTQTFTNNKVPADRGALLLKRAFDLTAALFGLLLLLPFFAWVAILIKKDSSGPVFYKGLRTGRYGEPFWIIKFRTMREETASYAGPRVTASGDTRITRIGQWLRDTKINELPQLINIVRGEMSLVGPRPEDPEITKLWSESERREILSVWPGITSPASISYRDEEKNLSSGDLMSTYLEQIAPDKLRLDKLYVRYHTFMSDLDVIFWTLAVLLPRLSRKPDTEGLLFGGPFTRLVRPYLNWTVLDFITTLCAAVLVELIWRTSGPLDLGWPLSLAFVLSFSFLFGIVNNLLGLNRVAWSRAAAEDILRLGLSCVLVTALGALIDLLIPDIRLPDGFILTAALVASSGFVLTRYRLRLITSLASRWVRSRSYGSGERVIIVGAGSGGELATWLLRHADFRHLFSVVGYVDDSPALQGMRFDGIPVLGTTADIPSLVKGNDIGLICYSIGRIGDADQARILRTCSGTGTRLVILANIMKNLQAQFVSPESSPNPA